MPIRFRTAGPPPPPTEEDLSTVTWELYVVDLTAGSDRAPTALTCSPIDTISDLRLDVSQAWDVPVSALRLFLKGQELTIYDDGAMLVNRGLRDGTSVDAVEVLPPPPRKAGWFASWLGQIVPSLASHCCADKQQAPAQRPQRRAQRRQPQTRQHDGADVGEESAAAIDGVMQALGPGAWPCGTVSCVSAPLPPLGKELSSRIVAALAAAVLARSPAMLLDIRLPNHTPSRLQHQLEMGLAGSGARIPGCMPHQHGGLSLSGVRDSGLERRVPL